jgi:outer membrane protein TolC
MSNRIFIILSPIFLWLCLSLAGCNSFNGQKIRREHAETYPRQLAEKTETVLADHKKLNLYDCIQIALENNLSVKSAEIQQRIAKLDKKVSFANFLPQVTLEYQKTWWDPQPQIKFGGTGISMHDKDVREITWNIQMSIFNPATWFMYSMHTRGYEIAELVTDFTRQAIALQTTAQYFQCISLANILEAIESQVSAAEAVEKELSAYRDEGLVADWQANQGRAFVLARRTELNQVRKSLRQAKAELLVSMGLDPLRDIELELQMPLEAPEGSLDELITDALLQHPNLAIADRQIEIEKEKVKLAISDFLPRLMGFAGRVDTSDSHQVFTDYWLGGLNAAVTVFNGFANLDRYEAAKERRKDVFIKREQATLTLMLQVIRASDQVQTAKEQVKLAESLNNIATEHLAEVKEKYQQGLVQTSDMLAMIAEADEAKINHLQAQLQYQMSIAVLINVMGKTQINFEDCVDEAK